MLGKIRGASPLDYLIPRPPSVHTPPYAQREPGNEVTAYRHGSKGVTVCPTTLDEFIKELAVASFHKNRRWLTMSCHHTNKGQKIMDQAVRRREWNSELVRFTVVDIRCGVHIL